ncbi:hypothetical protein ACFOGI_11230 [Virgibacillus xinjiangensis]|uniref:Uncharacterized protein n=1 Tax=Virgibacillus xinjiangensis TaxID=393090 RepID=A0ABV7CWS1_9BACI
MRMRWTSLVFMCIGTLTGFTIVFAAKGLWTDGFDWRQWLSWIIGGILGFLILLLIVRKGN